MTVAPSLPCSTAQAARPVVRAREVSARSRVAAPDLAPLVEHYQRELRLLDWRIDVSYAPNLRASDGSPVWGLCYPVADSKTARIVIRDPMTPPDGVSPDEAAAQVTETVVHELVHLHFAAFCTSEPEAVIAEEQAVWALAEALVNAKGTPSEAPLARAMVAHADAFAAARKHKITPAKAAKAGDKEMASLAPKLVTEALAALASKDGKGALTVLQALIASMLGGEAPAEEPAPPAEEAPPAEAAAPGEEEPKDESKSRTAVQASDAFSRAALALVGKADHAAALDEIARLKIVAVEDAERSAKVEAEKAAIAASAFEVQAVRVAKCSPVLAWADPHKATDRKARKYSSTIAGMSLEQVTAFADNLEAVIGKNRGAIAPPESESTTLSARELAMCAEKKIDPKAYAARKAATTKKAG